MEILAVFGFIVGCLGVILNLILASAVFSDCKKLRATGGRDTFLVGPGIWWLAVALGGLAAVAIYWAIHHSMLRPALALSK